MVLHYHVSMLLFSPLYHISCKMFVKYVPIKIPNISDVRIVTKRSEYGRNAYFSRRDERIGQPWSWPWESVALDLQKIVNARHADKILAWRFRFHLCDRTDKLDVRTTIVKMLKQTPARQQSQINSQSAPSIGAFSHFSQRFSRAKNKRVRRVYQDSLQDPRLESSGTLITARKTKSGSLQFSIFVSEER